MNNKIIKIKNAKDYIKNIKKHISLANICQKNAKEIFEGED